MELLIKKILLFFSFLILVIIGAEILIRKIPNDYSYKKAFLDNESKNIECLILGSSHSYFGINPSIIKKTTFNASHVSQTINWDIEILKKYEGKWDNLKFIVFPVDYLTLFSRISTSAKPGRVTNYHIYYDMKIPFNIKNYFEINQYDLKKNTERMFNYYSKGISIKKCDSLGFGQLPLKKVNFTEAGIKAAKRHTEKNTAYFLKNVDLLNDLIQFSKDHNVHLILITSPSYKSYYNNLNKEQLNLTFGTINDLIKQTSNCTYSNFLSSKTFTKKDFRDPDHLNLSGANKFSRIINSKIDSIEYNCSINH